VKKVTPRLLKGMRDYPPEDMIFRERLIDQLVSIFRNYGLVPLKTPALEYFDLLTAKSGDEASSLIYRMVDRGGRELGLRYDLTVPLSRFMALNPQLSSPFKRYQIQDVWRADKPQKGRFREFLQCDFDIVNSDSIYADAEIVAILNDCFAAMEIKDAVILINNRKFLKEIFLSAGCSDQMTDQACRIIDKYDKIGIDGVINDFETSGFDGEAVSNISQFLEIAANDNFENISELPWFSKKIEQEFKLVKDLYSMSVDFGVPENNLQITPVLSRGLDYYTGSIFEVKARNGEIGSLAGGGRYDGLIGYFSKKDIPAVGASIGLDRIITLLKERSGNDTQYIQKGVLIGIFDENFRKDSLYILNKLRKNGIQSEIQYTIPKLKKQLDYANKNNFRLFCFRGPDELNQNLVIIKNLKTGEQISVPEKKLIDNIRNLMEEKIA